MVYFESISVTMYACKIVVNTHVDALQVIWPLARIVLDEDLFCQFGRHVFIVNYAKS